MHRRVSVRSPGALPQRRSARAPWAGPIALAVAVLATSAVAAAADDADEFRIKREAVYEFQSKPAVTRSKDASSDPPRDRFTIEFTTKGLCDVTVAVEDAGGRIIRHLASGVLGPHAPAPLQKDSRHQALVWDGKDDAGRYSENTDRLRFRVSLGLQARFERTMFWSSKRRQSRLPPLMAARPEGVYVYDGGNGIDSLCLYDHAGHYLRTLYPFPADKIDQAKGVTWRSFAQDGAKLPVKTNFLQCSFLTGGGNSWNIQTYNPRTDQYRSVVGVGDNEHYGMYGAGASAMAVAGSRIALADALLNRLGADGTTGGLELTGPRTFIDAPLRRDRPLPTARAVPRSAALSPDGRWLYLTCYIYGARGHASQDIQYTTDWRCVPAVVRLDMEAGPDAKAEVFRGSIDPTKCGSGDDRFNVPGSVATDAAGRVYVADHLNDRVQVFASDGNLLKSIKVKRPAKVAINQKNGEIYVFSWKLMNEFDTAAVLSRLTRFGPFDNPKELASYPLGIQVYGDAGASRYRSTGVELFAELDGWADEPTIWITREDQMSNVLSRQHATQGTIVLLAIRDGKVVRKHNFGDDVAALNIPPGVEHHQRQRLYVDETTSKLYVAEGDDAANGKSFQTMFELDPASSSPGARPLAAPFDAEDMCFDLSGMAYFRSVETVGRFEKVPAGGADWREVPWDYGEERKGVAYGWNSGTKRDDLVSGLVMPSDGGWHHGGMFVSARGNMIVGCLLGFVMEVRTDAKFVHVGKPYKPPVFPGRLLGGRGGATCVHVWDSHGRLVREDAVPGLADLYGVAIDNSDQIYVMSAATRVLDGKRYYNDMSGTVMKFPADKGRVLTASEKIPVPLDEASYPKRPFDVTSAMQGSAWVEGAEWLYGGVGFGGKNMGVGCACWNFRFAHDYFDRSFAPEMDRYSVAVLDSAGNMVMRIGRYGNVDDGKPLNPTGGPPTTRPIGGDEVALMHGAYLATDTDRRLFIADPGNGRVLSVKLEYHTNELVNLAQAGN
ncbi:MAG: hypothetical protein BIFFINMI_02594 [Phycisphaerae bacterium]|nr:hypothetical protein [Phycisphaerae bacterium]